MTWSGTIRPNIGAENAVGGGEELYMQLNSFQKANE